MESQDAWMGRLMKRYLANRALRAKLRDDLNDAGKKLSHLGQELTGDISVGRFNVLDENTIELTYNAFRIAPRLIIEIHDMLNEFTDAEAERGQLESCMRDAGMGEWVK